MKKKHILIGIAAIIILIIALWITGVIPKMIGKQAAIRYVKENYSEIDLTYQNIEFSTAYDDYIVSFSDEAGATYNFRLSSKYFPTSVAYDSVKQSKDDSTHGINFPAYEEDNTENKPYLEEVNHTPQFQVHADFPDGWTVREPIADDELTVPGEFYTPLILCEQDQPIGYIGFNLFEPYDGEIPQEQYYQTVYSALRLPSTFHWDPYTAIKSTDTAETGIADIWYLDENEIDNHPGAMPDVPQFETIGILSYDKELEVYIGIAFLPGAVDRAQAEAIAQSIELSPLK